MRRATVARIMKVVVVSVVVKMRVEKRKKKELLELKGELVKGEI